MFRIRAVNAVGLSTDSIDHIVITTSVPDAPSIFNTDADSTSSITISWTEPNNGGEPISDYEIDWN